MRSSTRNLPYFGLVLVVMLEDVLQIRNLVNYAQVIVFPAQEKDVSFLVARTAFIGESCISSILGKV